MSESEYPAFVQEHLDCDCGKSYARVIFRYGKPVKEDWFPIKWGVLSLAGKGVSTEEMVDKINKSAEFYDN